MKLRNIPVLLEPYNKTNTASELMALGFAGHILFMECEEEDGKYYGTLHSNKYLVQDDNAHLYAEKWHKFTNPSLASSILSDKALWDTDLTALTGFAELVAAKLKGLQNGHIKQVIKEAQIEKELT